MSAAIESLGLKSVYAFKETHIPTSHSRKDIHRQLRETIAPAIRDLESQGLINGFHHIVHDEIDLRLSCHDWPNLEASIQAVLETHSIPFNLKDWGPMPAERYGGEIGVALCYNNLEFNSRLCLALAELMNETQGSPILQMQERLCPHQWIHYLCNQFGYLNIDQITFELNDAFTWLESLITRNRGNPEVPSIVRGILSSLRQAIDQCEENWLGQQ